MNEDLRCPKCGGELEIVAILDSDSGDDSYIRYCTHCNSAYEWVEEDNHGTKTQQSLYKRGIK